MRNTIIKDEQTALINYSVAVLANVAQCAEQENKPIYEKGKKIDNWVRLSDVENILSKYLNCNCNVKEKKNEYYYFVSFSHFTNGNLGMGEVTVHTNKKISDRNDINRIRDGIEKECNVHNVSVLNFILL